MSDRYILLPRLGSWHPWMIFQVSDKNVVRMSFRKPKGCIYFFHLGWFSPQLSEFGHTDFLSVQISGKKGSAVRYYEVVHNYAQNMVSQSRTAQFILIFGLLRAIVVELVMTLTITVTCVPIRIAILLFVSAYC